MPGVAGTWKDLTDSVNTMGSNLTAQVRNIAEVTTAVARGDLSRKITVDVKGEILELKNTINTMVDQLNGFASEVTRVAREVGTEGKLGGQAQVSGVGGTWKDLTDNVNFMASNLTEQVRGIVKVVTAVADGNLRQKLTVQAKGEVAALADTINNMTDTLATFAEQVISVAREVGVEGRLGGQASVPGAAGSGATHRQRQPAGRQSHHAGPRHRRGGDRGDQGRPDAIDPGRDTGEVAELKDNINTMIANLRETTERNQRAGLAEDQHRPIHQHAPGPARSFTVGADAAGRSGAAGARPSRGRSTRWPSATARTRADRCLPSYAHGGTGQPRDHTRSAKGSSASARWKSSEFFSPTCRRIIRRISSSASGERSAVEHRAAPALRRADQGGHRAGLAEAIYRRPTSSSSISSRTSIGVVLNTIEATMRTEGLLKQSQQLTVELQSRQSELQQDQ